MTEQSMVDRIKELGPYVGPMRDILTRHQDKRENGGER